MPSQLLRWALGRFARGGLTAVDVSEVIEAAWQDGWRGGEEGEAFAVELSKTSDAPPKYASQNLQRALTRLGVASPIPRYDVRLEGPGREPFTLQVELPSDRFRYELARVGIDELGGAAGDRQLEAQLEQWRVEVGVEKSVAAIVPIKLHGDGVRVTRRRKMYVIDFSPASGPWREKRWAFAAIASERMCACGCRGWHTLNELFRVLVWDLDHCARGLQPSHNHKSEEMADGGRGEMPTLAVVRIAGDWEFFVDILHIRGWAHERICWRCDATRDDGEAPWTDVGPLAAWRATRVLSTAEFLERAVRVPSSTLLQLPGFRFDVLAIDVLHTWCLGVTGTIVGSFLLEWCRGLHRPSLPRAVLELNARLRDYNAITRRLNKNFASVPSLTWGNLQPKEGNAGVLVTIKGAEARGLVGLAYKLSIESCVAAADDDFEYRTARHCCVAGLRDFYASLEKNPFEPASCADATRRAIENLKRMNLLAREPGMPSPAAWHLTPKVHLAQELGEFQCRVLGNPKIFWCYRDETYMGVVKRICLKTSHPRTMEKMLRWKLDILEWLDA